MGNLSTDRADTRRLVRAPDSSLFPRRIACSFAYRLRSADRYAGSRRKYSKSKPNLLVAYRRRLGLDCNHRGRHARGSRLGYRSRGNSRRDIKELLFKHSAVVSHETVRRWFEKFGARFARRVEAPVLCQVASHRTRPKFVTSLSKRAPSAVPCRHRAE